MWSINSLLYTDDDFCASFATDRPVTENGDNVSSTNIPTSVVDVVTQNSFQRHIAEAMVRDVLKEFVDEATKPKIKIHSIVTILKPIDVKPTPKKI